MLSRMLTSRLSRIRNADFNRVLAGPYASLICSDFGAFIWGTIRPEEFGYRAIGGCSSLFDPPKPEFFGRRGPKRWSRDNQEQECLKDYRPGGYYPVRIGEVLHQQYHALRKLGWGSSSITWLCWDEEGKRFVALKILKSAERYGAGAMEEVKMLLACQEDKDGEHPKRVVQLINKFTIDGPNGIHVCLVLEAFGGDVLHLIISNKFKPFVQWQAREIVRQILEGLRHLHENNIVHADIKPENLLFTKAPNELRQKAEEALYYTEDRLAKAGTGNWNCPDITPGGGKLFQLQDLTEAIGDAVKEDYWQGENEGWEIKICDLGSACWARDRHIENVQNRQYCSPELVIGAEFGPPTDIWSTACLAFELTTGEYLFSPNEPVDLKKENQLARIIELLGPVPPHILKNGSKWKDVFYESGRLLNSPEPEDPESKDPLLDYFDDHFWYWKEEETEEFADFLNSMLKYDPNERATAAQCLKHPWLRSRAARPSYAIVYHRNSTASDRVNSLLNSPRSIDIQYGDLEGVDSAAFLKELCASAKFPVSVHLDSVEFDDRTIAECAIIVADGNWEVLKFVHDYYEHDAFYTYVSPSVVALMEKWVNGEAPRFQSVQFGLREDERWIELFTALEQLGSLENGPAGTVTIKHGTMEGLVAKVEFDYETCRSESHRVKTGRSHLCIHVCEEED